MITKMIIPVSILSLFSYGVIYTISNTDKIEYYDNNQYSDDLNQRYDQSSNIGNFEFQQNNEASEEISNQNQIKAYTNNSAQAKVAKTSTKSSAPKSKKATKAKNKVTAKKTMKKQRKPSQVEKKGSATNKNQKLEVPSNLPKVKQSISTNQTLGNEQNSENGQEIVKSFSTPDSTNSNVVDNEDSSIEETIKTTPYTNQVVSKAALTQLNISLAKQFETNLPVIKNQLAQDLLTALQEHFKEQSEYNLTILNIESIHIASNQNKGAFGLNVFGRDGISPSFPLVGNLDIQARVKIYFENDQFKTQEIIDLNIENFSMHFPMRFVKKDSGQTFITEQYKPIIKYDLSISSSSFMANYLYSSLGSFYPKYIRASIDKFQYFANTNVQSQVISTVKAKSPSKKINIIKEMDATKNNILENIFVSLAQNNIQDGQVYSVVKTNNENLSLGESFQNKVENSESKKTILDLPTSSAIESGKYLAALSMRYKLKQEQDITKIKGTLKAIDRLFKVHNYSGQIAKHVIALDSDLANKLISEGGQIGSQLILKEIDNKQWLYYQGSDPVSMQDYNFILYGLTTTYINVNNSKVRNKIKFLVKSMINYLEKKDWLTKEIGNSTFWDKINTQQLTYYTVAENFFPGAFSAKLQVAQEMASIAWLNVFFKINYFEKNIKEISSIAINLYVLFQFDQSQIIKESIGHTSNMIAFYSKNFNTPTIDLIMSILSGQRNSDSIHTGIMKTLSKKSPEAATEPIGSEFYTPELMLQIHQLN